MLQVAVIGACGATGRAHVEALARAGVSPGWLVDRAPALEDLARAQGAQGVSHVRDLPEDVDAAVVALPPRLHPAVCVGLLERGVAVLCEKPVATSVRAAAPLVRAAGRPGARFMAGFQLRFDPALLRLRGFLAGGRLGRVVAVRVEKAHRKPSGDWRLDAGGGVTRIKDVHDYDLIPWLTRLRPLRAWAIGGSPFHGGEAEDLAVVQLELEGGAGAQVLSAWWHLAEPRRVVEVLGTGGLATWDGAGLVVRRPRGTARWAPPVPEDPLVAQARAFLRYAQGRTPCPTPVEEGVRALAVTDAVLRSLRHGSRSRVVDPAAPA